MTTCARFCAICTSERGPFTPQPIGAGDAVVWVCAACDEPIIAKTGTDRGYEPSGGLPTYVQARRADRVVFGADHDRVMADRRRIVVSFRALPPGWRIHRVHLARGLDLRDAYRSLASQPWFGPGRVKYCGSTFDWFVFGYAPDVKLALPADDDPLAAIRKYQVTAKAKVLP